MTYLLDELEKAGLVERRPDPTDRRAKKVLITDAGSAALADHSERVSERESRLLAPLDAAEAAAFSSMLVRVARVAQNGADGGGGVCPTDPLP